MTDPHPFAPKFEHAFTISIDLSKPFWVKPTARGETRAAIYAAAGTVEGPRFNGRVIPMSGGDFPLQRPNGAIVYLENRGYRGPKSEAIGEQMRANQDVAFEKYYMRVTPRFDAPAGPHEWMSKHVFVGVAEKLPGANRIHYFVVL